MNIEQELHNDITQKASELLNKIDRQLSWRKKEITDIFSYIHNQPTGVENIQNKMVHCLWG